MSLTNKDVFSELENLVTEESNPASVEIDCKNTTEILEIISAQDHAIAEKVRVEIPNIALAVEILVNSFKNGGRLFYVGAGTSGRLGVLDASECPPTFGVQPDLIQGIIAGGFTALIQAKEGSEDRYEAAAQELAEVKLTNKDVVCGISASYRTPFVLGAIDCAKKVNAKTIYISCNPRSKMNFKVDVFICPVVGPEVISGSTRMKAGTATKLVLNMLTTTAMIKLGKVYGNRMVDLKMTSQKLKERSKKTVMSVTGVEYSEAEIVLEKAGGHVKTAIVMILKDVDAHKAEELLEENDGFVRAALNA